MTKSLRKNIGRTSFKKLTEKIPEQRTEKGSRIRQISVFPCFRAKKSRLESYFLTRKTCVK